MGAFWEVAVIIAVFFGSGIALGVFMIIALPAIRQHRYLKRHPEYDPYPLPPPPRDDEDEGPPRRWPGDSGLPR
jgi:hypothetical protein